MEKKTTKKTRKNPLFSVIVPVYNSEKYLNKCIDSILKQSFDNYELLLINDGSTDKSLEICKKYERLDSRVKVYNKKNSGTASTRNFGLFKAKGDYVVYVDSDDSIETCHLKKNSQIIKQHKISAKPKPR